jgi:hypothetical protein
MIKEEDRCLPTLRSFGLPIAGLQDDRILTLKRDS